MATPTTLPATFVAGNVLTAAQMNDLRGAFRVLQVVSTAKTDTFSTTSTTFVDLTGLTVSITPSSANSKVLIICNIGVTNTSTASGMASKLVRGATDIGIGDAASSRTRATKAGVGNAARNLDLSFTFLDSPATTSATTYKVQVMTGNGGTLIVNASGDDTNFAYHPRFIATITAMEISA